MDTIPTSGAILGRRLEGVRLTGEAGPRLRALVLAAGELASTRLGVEALRREEIPAAWVDARLNPSNTLVSRSGAYP